VKRSADKWHAHLSDHVAFYSYRWLSWAVAGLTFTLPGRQTADMPRDAALLLMLLLVNVALTALAYGYVRLARRRPALLALDLLFGCMLIWLSGSAFLPYLPYALGALLLPALIFGWRGALLSSLAFVALDFAGITLLAADGPVDLPGLTARALVPFAFSFCWVAAAQVLPHNGGQSGAQPQEPAPVTPLQARAPGPGAEPGAVVRLAQRAALERGSASGPANVLGAAPAALARTTSASQADPSRRVIYELTPGPHVALPTAIELLATRVSQRGGPALRVALVGAVQPLNPAQHSVLLRAAQEALLNIQQHARARAAQLTLTFEPRAVTLVVQDDGVGLLDGTYERPGLHALRALRYRLAELDGQLAVFEGESGGVTVRATLPLE
jgi:hypothetical protein